MKIELKKLKISLAHSEETTLFNAELYIDGVNVGYAKNDGRGGCTDYNAYDKEKRVLIEKAEAHCKTLPKIQADLGGGRKFEYDSSLESVIDDLVEKELKKKDMASFNKKLQKDMLNKICFGVPNSGAYTTIGWNKPHTIASLLLFEKGKQAIKDTVARIKSELKEGEKIFNTNIPADL